MKKSCKIVSLAMAALLSIGSLAGCAGGTDTTDGKVQLKVGNWIPKSASEETHEMYARRVATYEEMYPDYEVVEGDTYSFDVKTFNARAAAGQLPAFLDVYFTEFQSIDKNNYNSDIKQALIDNDLYDKINPDMLEILTTDEGEVMGIPSYGYAQGLVINKDIFAQAGLVDENGTPIIPQTWEELAETAKVIKEKTGIAGFVMPSTANCGGWIFMNIAFSYGVEFVELLDDGSWKAAFDTQEFRDALQYLYDLRWKYNVLPDNVLLDYAGYLKTFSVGQAAMTISDPGTIATESFNYEMDRNKIYVARIPEGPKGRITQLGGGARVFFNGNTPEENDAGVKWLMLEGYTPFITEEVEANLREKYQKASDEGKIVFPAEIFPMWKSEERDAKMAEILADYTNVNMEDYADYIGFEDVTMKPEPARCAQELYSILDKAVQEIFTNENADIEKLTVESLKDFQVNHLDKIN